MNKQEALEFIKRPEAIVEDSQAEYHVVATNIDEIKPVLQDMASRLNSVICSKINLVVDPISLGRENNISKDAKISLLTSHISHMIDSLNNILRQLKELS